jgi:phospholipid/cholesterol/gamma-HCH transport system substrate-binding protein
MRRSMIETIMGAVVLIVAGLFLYLAEEATDFAQGGGGYELTARFNAVDGLTLGSDVRLGGVKIGTVTSQRIDPELYQAVITARIEEGVRIPEDSQASISSDGLLGGMYLKIEPGTADTLLAGGDEITDTKDVVKLEDLLGRAIFLIAED